MTMLGSALDLASIGLRVFALGSRSKLPVTAHGFLDASDDPAVIRNQWRLTTNNVGLATGRLSGVFVLDVDGADGESSLEALRAGREAFVATPEVRTHRGRHVYLEHPAGLEIKSSAEKYGKKLDVRANGGYVVVPPSVHPDGTVYSWMPGRSPFEIPFAPAPTWLLELLTAEPPKPERKPYVPAHDVYGHTRYGRSALEAECVELARHPEGGRNHRLNEVAFRVGQLVHAGHLQESMAEAEVLVAARSAGLDERESRQTFASGFKAGIAKPNANDPDPNAPPPKRERVLTMRGVAPESEPESEEPSAEPQKLILTADEAAESALVHLTDPERAKMPRTGFPKLDDALGGFPPGTMTTIGGRTGCITGDAMIGINRAGIGKLIRLDKLVAKFNGGHFKGEKDWRPDIQTFVRARLDAGTVGLVRLRDAYASGVKSVYTVRLKTGHVVSATKDHRFLTADGWKPLGEIRVGESVYIENGLDVLDPKDFAVHHGDEDRRNNNIDNLEVLTHSEHNRRHIAATLRAIPVTTKLSMVELIDYAGEQATYDLSLDEPHNFIASGVVVHNSGKSSLMLAIAMNQAGPRNNAKVGIISCEDSEWVWGVRIMASLRDVNPERFFRLPVDPTLVGLSQLAIVEAKQYGIHIAFPIGKPLAHVLTLARQLIDERGCSVLMVDYLQAISATGQDRYTARTDAAQALKGLCHDKGVALVLASQLKRPEAGSPFREPNSTDMKDSGDIENMSEAILLLWPDSDGQNATTIGKVSKVKWSSQRPRFSLGRNPNTGAVTSIDDAPSKSAPRRNGYADNDYE
jgi:replicative DNA helicase